MIDSVYYVPNKNVTAFVVWLHRKVIFRRQGWSEDGYTVVCKEQFQHVTCPKSNHFLQMFRIGRNKFPVYIFWGGPVPWFLVVITWLVYGN